ncbi:threonylcarbamoyl-AMP synthase [Paenibacillus profundus]|uniref:Threonylcarbamoyl-AMP synthase n=1 Tax=Paenibacillus profundus TaxID=1173085 RepID=A0ABS8YFJ1_9BACL|nr:L-threonylcarbamoyladenylate synthase [Paenibacillus profundus]MCE5169238.1 threonylcarbamoyl-AMP synthase [Paenibacillus profundus]
MNKSNDSKVEANRIGAPISHAAARPQATKWWTVDGAISVQEQACIVEAAAMLAAGQTVAFPTETVYGLGANACDSEAVERIFIAKGRPSDNPLIVHIADVAQLDALVLPYGETAQRLMERFWPGPLTIVLPVRPNAVSSRVTAGLDTVGVRMPAHDTALALIRAAGCPIAAPSANRSGRPSPTRAEHVRADLDGLIGGIVDGGPAGVGLESTVLEVQGDRVHVLRPGGITTAMLREVAAEVTVDPAVDPNGGMTKALPPSSPSAAPIESQRMAEHASGLAAEPPLKEGAAGHTAEQAAERSGELLSVQPAPRSPGMKYTHYAPQGTLSIVQGPSAYRVSRCIQAELDAAKGRGETTGVLAFREHAEQYRADIVASLGSVEALEEAAHHLYDALRHFDEAGATYMLAEACPAEGMGLAVMNRLIKAAGHRIIHC